MPSPDELRQRRDKISEEILSTESSYVQGLETLQSFFNIPEVKKILTTQIPTYNRFLSPIVGLNKQLLADMQDRQSKNPKDADAWKLEEVLLHYGPSLKMYGDYAANYKKMDGEFGRLLQENKKFKKLHDGFFKDKHPNSISAFLIMPIQRGPRYRLLVEDLIRHMPVDHSRYGTTKRALDAIVGSAAVVNETVRQKENEAEFRQYLQKLPEQDPIRQFVVKFEKTKGPLNINIKNELRELGPHQEETRGTYKLFANYLTSKSFLAQLNDSKMTSNKIQPQILGKLKEAKIIQLLNKIKAGNTKPEDISTLRNKLAELSQFKKAGEAIVSPEFEKTVNRVLKFIEKTESIDKQIQAKRAEISKAAQLSPGKAISSEARIKRDALLQEVNKLEAQKAAAEATIKSDITNVKHLYLSVSESIINNLDSMYKMIKKEPDLQVKLRLNLDELNRLQIKLDSLGYKGNSQKHRREKKLA